MSNDSISLAQLKVTFVERYKKDELYPILKEIYELYESELLRQSDLFFKKIFKTLSIKQTENFDKEVFLYDFMLRICDYLFLRFHIIHLEHEVLKKKEDGILLPKLFYYKTEKEFDNKYQNVEKSAIDRCISYSLVYMSY